MPSNTDEFKLRILAEHVKVKQTLLKMILEVSDSMTSIRSIDRIEVVNFLNVMISDIDKLYEKIESKDTNA